MSLAQGHAQLFSNVPFINHGRVSDGAGVVYVQGAGLQDCRIAGGAAGSGGSGGGAGVLRSELLRCLVLGAEKRRR